VAGIKEAITATGATVRYLPPDSPDLNPTEKFFSKFQVLLRKAAKRDIDALGKEIGELLNTVSPRKGTNFFASCGYVSTYIETALASRSRCRSTSEPVTRLSATP
jgi:transposase